MANIKKIAFHYKGKDWYYHGVPEQWVHLYKTRWYVKVNKEGTVTYATNIDPQCGERPTAFREKKAQPA